MNLNRRVPNGLPGGVRGRKFYYFLLLDFIWVKKIRAGFECVCEMVPALENGC